jgi:hypothetical protein
MTGSPSSTCGRATSNGTYHQYLGNSSRYLDLKNASLYVSNASANTYAWLAAGCTQAFPWVTRGLAITSIACAA